MQCRWIIQRVYRCLDYDLMDEMMGLRGLVTHALCSSTFAPVKTATPVAAVARVTNNVSRYIAGITRLHKD